MKKLTNKKFKEISSRTRNNTWLKPIESDEAFGHSDYKRDLKLKKKKQVKKNWPW